MVRSDTDEKLIESALLLVSQKGYLGTSTKEIAQKAGVTEVTLFRHFGSKERLFEEVLNRHTFLPRLRDLLSRGEDSSHDFPDTLQLIGISFFETLKERKSLVRIMMSEINVYPEKIRVFHSKCIDETIQLLEGYLKSQQEKGVLKKFPSDIGSRAFLGMIFAYFNTESIIKGRDISDKEIKSIVKEFVNIFTYGILKMHSERIPRGSLRG